MLFVWVISVALTVLAILNAALSEGVFGVIGVSLGGGVLYTFYAVALAFAIDALLALFIRRALPGKWFNHKKAAFTVGTGEKNFYETIKIRKTKFPNGAGLRAFRKTKSHDRRITLTSINIFWNCATEKRFISFRRSPGMRCCF